MGRIYMAKVDFDKMFDDYLKEIESRLPNPSNDGSIGLRSIWIKDCVQVCIELLKKYDNLKND